VGGLTIVKKALGEALLYCTALSLSLIVWLLGTALLVKERLKTSLQTDPSTSNGSY